jgi:nucleoside diphosphate kinase
MARNEVRKIAEEFSEMYEVDEFIDIYDEYMASKPYVFVVWDRRKKMSETRWTYGFTDPFPPSRKEMEIKQRRGDVE